MRDDQGKWVKGSSGNPNGRPKDTITELLREKLDKEKFVNALLGHAYEGDIRCIAYVYDRLCGKVPDRIAGEEGEELVIRIVRDAD